MVTLREDGWVKARKGITTIEEILRVTQEDT
jgi:type II secretory ATPase GspE/PulE/Tfp pilus assembly ATPase PilB-like protein